MISDEQYMRRALFLAQLGLENTAPNPMVGAVIVYQDKIIGEGYHQRCGEAHAEVNAVNAVVDKSLLAESTIYVTLEPCAHFGKTPPCANLLVAHNFKRVVIAMQDPFSKVAGKGIALLRENGIDVEIGVLEQEARALNKRFLTFHEKKRPYISLKWAQSQDGFMDIERVGNEKGVFWITQPETKNLTHKWRAEEQAILVGATTVLVDNPSLTTRSYVGNNPIRLLLDPNKRVPNTAAVFAMEGKTVQFVNSTAENRNQVQLTPFDLTGLMSWCFNNDISSILIEGGLNTLEQFIATNLWDEARILTGASILGSGKIAPRISGAITQDFLYGKDHIQIIRNL